MPTPPFDSASLAKTEAYILGHWEDTVRFEKEDAGTLLGLPFPYTIPSRKDAFQELYYWDTYFTSLGLVGSGRGNLARDNARNLLAQAQRFGYVPNGNRTYYITRSQPPYLAALVGLVAASEGNDALIREALPLLEREYEFWLTRRSTPTGLARFGHNASREELIEFFPGVQRRVGLEGQRAEDVLETLAHTMAEAESGWDFNHRFDHRCLDFCPVDLNSTLFLMETLLAKWTTGDASATWQERASQRRERVNALCWNEERGAYFDYDFVNQRQGGLLAASTFQPLWAGLADERQAAAMVQKALPLLEYPHGIATAQPGARDRVGQWDYPNAWPCLQNIAYRGLERYGFLDEARRIAGKYAAAMAGIFESTGDLWEKYNVLDGSVRTQGEAGYLLDENTGEAKQMDASIEMPSMMGWTAGVFIDAVRFLRGESPFWLLH